MSVGNKKTLAIFSEKSMEQYRYLVHDLHQFLDVSDVLYNLPENSNQFLFYIINHKTELFHANECGERVLPISCQLLSQYVKRQNSKGGSMKINDILEIMAGILQNTLICSTQIEQPTRVL